ncbi:hypothetical protein Y032_0074g853 [Ancylostoma ceylanicum]|uniref:Uncharacterized protein n=1 Tax=Ancylostoma ceylanicum TaxID=53326 RepID=A0A016TWI2_9BILA|nr:hypothetical protein Y032_0074g853 [Ancylostoma ceylanicum]
MESSAPSSSKNFSSIARRFLLNREEHKSEGAVQEQKPPAAENMQENQCNGSGIKGVRIQFSPEENRYLVARFVESYDEYHGHYNTKTSKFVLKELKVSFHQKWAEDFSTRGPYKRTPQQVYDRLRKICASVKEYIKALKRYKSGEIDESQLPPLKPYLYPLVRKISEHERRLYKLQYPYLPDDVDELMAMDDSLPPGQADALAACSSSVDDGDGMDDVLFLPVAESKKLSEEPVPILVQDVLGTDPSLEQDAVVFKEEITDVKPPIEEAVVYRPLTANEVESQPTPFIPPVSADIALCPTVPAPSNLLCEGLRMLTTKRLTIPMGTYDTVFGRDADAAPVGIRAKIVVKRVRQFFEELKKLLGDSCKGTVLDSPVEMTAMACGVSPVTVRSLGVRSEFVHENFPRNKLKVIAEREKKNAAAVKKYGEEWGKIVMSFIKEKLEKDDMTVSALHKLLCDEYDNFPMSKRILFRFTKGMGVPYGRKMGISYMLL